MQIGEVRTPAEAWARLSIRIHYATKGKPAMFWKSKTIWGGVLVAIAHAIGELKPELKPVVTAVETIGGILGIVGLRMAVEPKPATTTAK
jgi:hypothetical protein